MKPREAHCSFCRKSYRDVGPLLEGPEHVYICGECTALCQEIIEQEKKRRRDKGPIVVEPPAVRTILDKLINGQDSAKAMLAGVARSEARVLLVGSSPSSRMLLAKAFAHAMEAPFVAGDPSSLDQPGEGNLLFQLMLAAGCDIKLSQRGVVYVEEVDTHAAQDVLVRLWRKNVTYLLRSLEFDLRGLCFVCGGTFAGLEDAILRLGRHPEQSIPIEALVAAGGQPDWANRFSGIARVPPLDEVSLARIVQWVDFGRADGKEV